MRRLARRPQISPGPAIVDIVGTGGDASGSFNISTGTALLAAACGLRVVKHGNRAVSSRSGSADLLEALGLKIPLDESAAGRCLDATGFTFLFAPHYHPALKALAPIRGALGVRTVFNMLGPLANPAEPPFHLIGAFSLEAAGLIAHTLAGMNIERAFVVHGEPGWDEPTPVGPFALFDVRPGRVTQETREAAQFGLESCSASDLAGGDVSHNAAALRAVLEGRDRGAHRDALLMGAALTLELTGQESDPHRAAKRAAAVIESGQARELLDRLVNFGVATP
jgi:anthranilate phosphoribosyltransferase